MPYQESQRSPMASCIDACLACYRVCQETAMTHCLEQGGEHVDPEHFRLMMACAEACRSAAAMMIDASPFHTASCALCAEVCRVCAESCRELGDMQACVAACERCADECARMSAEDAGPRPTIGAQPQFRLQ